MNEKTPVCPVCQAPTDFKYRPFCSRRCADVDLGRWFSEEYCILENDLDSVDENTDSKDDSMA